MFERAVRPVIKGGQSCHQAVDRLVSGLINTSAFWRTDPFRPRNRRQLFDAPTTAEKQVTNRAWCTTHLCLDAEETTLQNSDCSGRDRPRAGAEGATAPETLRQTNRAMT